MNRAKPLILLAALFLLQTGSIFNPAKDNFAEANPNKTQVFPNEQITLDYQLFVRTDLRYEGFKKEPHLPYQWIESQPLFPEKVVTQTVKRGSKKFVTTSVQKIAIFPIMPGKFIMEPGKLKAINRFPGKEVPQEFTLSPITIEVQPFPEEGKPAGFSGLTGNFTIRSSGEVIQKDGGDIVELEVELEGTGNIRQAELKEPAWGMEWALSSRDHEVEVGWEGDVVKGKKKFIYTLTPSKSGELSVPLFSFHYFDSETRQYKTIATNPQTFSISSPAKFEGERKASLPGRKLMILIDLSGSMLALDFDSKSRIDAAKEVLESILRKKQNELIGLMAFAKDVQILREIGEVNDDFYKVLSDLEIGAIADGTSIGSGIYEALQHLRQYPDQEGQKSILLITDGTNNAGYIDPQTAAEMAAEKTVKIHAIVLGRGGWVPFPVHDPEFNVTKTVQAEVPVDETALKSISAKTNGSFYRVGNTQELGVAVEGVIQSVF